MKKIKRKARSDKGKTHKWRNPVRPKKRRTVEEFNAEQALAKKHQAAQKRTAKEERLRSVVREAAETGLVAALEHTHNFWDTSNGYRRYIAAEIAERSQVMAAAMRAAIKEELAVVLGRWLDSQMAARKHGRPRK